MKEINRVGRSLGKKNHLATEGTESERIKEAPTANLTGIGDAFSRSLLRSFVEEHNLSAVYNICLDI